MAHFINRLVFCMFAEDVDLLPNKMFKRMLEHTLALPDEFQIMASDLFRAMKTGGRIGFEHVAWFNGGLFNDDAALPLDKDDIALTLGAAALDWAEIDPSILGTLFERGLDPGKRSQLGAHYTEWLTMPLNPNGRPNADVLKPTVSGIDLARRPLDRWVIDFGTRSEAEAALYEAVFAYAVASI
ncbi:MAG: type IIL restriction-modification enzyme MmeI, partial [Pseudolabrys sp.]